MLLPVTPADVVLRESATGLSVSFATTERYFPGSDEQCDERAKQAAVFIALMLDPLHLPPREPASAPVPAATAPARSTWDLELGPVLAFAPSAGSQALPVAGGGAFRVRGGGLLSFSAGATLLSTLTLHYPQAQARELLIPLDAGGRLTWMRHGWDLGFELGASVSPAFVRGQNLDRTESGWGLEWGGRSAVLGRWWFTRRVGLLVSATGLLWPRPIVLKVAGVGEVGHTPSFWVGSELGLVLNLN